MFELHNRLMQTLRALTFVAILAFLPNGFVRMHTDDLIYKETPDIVDGLLFDEKEKPGIVKHNVGEKLYHGNVLRAMANQLFVTVDSHNQLVANFSYKYPDELSRKHIFYIVEEKEGTVTLKSGHNALHVCLDADVLVATCNASIEGQEAARFSLLCHSHFKGIIMGVGGCKVFGLRSLENGHSVTINLEKGSENYGVLMVRFIVR